MAKQFFVNTYFWTTLTRFVKLIRKTVWFERHVVRPKQLLGRKNVEILSQMNTHEWWRSRANKYNEHPNRMCTT